MKHAALIVLTLWTATFTLINAGVGNRGFYGAAIDQGHIGRLERRRRTLPGSEHKHKNSKITLGSQTGPAHFNILCSISKKHKNEQEQQHITKMSYAKRNNAPTGIARRSRIGKKIVLKMIPMVRRMALKRLHPGSGRRSDVDLEASPFDDDAIQQKLSDSVLTLLEIWGVM